MPETDLPAKSGMDEALPADYRWNARAFCMDMALFQVGMSFISPTTVLPSFVATLTDSEVIVGLASGLVAGGWLLPQLLVASAVAHLPRKKPFIMRAAWLGRPILLLAALVIWQWGQRSPKLTLIITLASVFGFFVVDAMVSVPWFDLLARCIPPRKRGRVLGSSQVLGGLGGIGVGVAVRFVLSEGSPWTFPANYAALFATASVAMLGSTVALGFIREPKPAVRASEVPSIRQVLALLPRMLARDRPFQRLVVANLLRGFVGLASAFYVLHATRPLGLGAETTGLFVSAQVAGSLVAGLLMGAVQDRFGPLVHIRAVAVLSALPPILALGAELLHGSLGRGVLYPYLLVYFLLGLSAASYGWPFFNWILEYAEEARRPLYIGIINTLGAATMLAPILGGWVVSAFTYPAVFALALAFALSALVASLSLPSTR